MRAGKALLGTLVALAAVACAASPAAAATGGHWVARSLAAQYRLGDSVPLRNAQWIGTHNSFNSPAEMGLALSAQDANQRIDLTQQLDLGIRSLELDLHWFPSLTSGDGQLFAPVVCHALPNHAGCTVEKPLGPVLDEIAAWLREPSNRRQVLLLYLEDHLDNSNGYDTAGATVSSRLGSLLYRPRGAKGCHELPLGLTRKRVLAAGAQVVIVTNSCGRGDAPLWRGVGFDWSGQHVEAQAQHGFEPYPNCGPDFTHATYRTKLVRYFEELGEVSTLAGAGGWPITAPMAGQMARCGVDLVSFDFVVPGDPRLAAMVWSWAPGEPGHGRCAFEDAGGRWRSAPCEKRHRVACRAHGRWTIPPARVGERGAAQACRGLGARFAVPRTGYEAQQLRTKMARTRAGATWIGYRKQGGRWRAGG